MIRTFLHPADVFFERGGLRLAVGALESDEFGDAGSVGGIFDHAQLQVGRVFFPELVVIFLGGILELLDHVEGFADELLLNDLE